jgi:transposase
MKNNEPARTRRKFCQEFKDDAVRLVIEKGQSLKSVADDLGIDESLVGRWRREYLARAESSGNRGDRALTPKEMDQEIRQLRSQLRRVSEQRDILKKALSIFSQ